MTDLATNVRMGDGVNEGFERLDELLAKMPLPVG
jgi:hypothetical protein